MATIQKRKNSKGLARYRVMIRQSDGFPPASKTFPTRQEAKDWAQQEEARRRQGLHSPQQTAKRILSDLIDRYISIILPHKPKNAKDTHRHLQWWKDRLGKYAIQALSPELIAECRQELFNGKTPKGSLRSPATVNRYIAALSSVLSYAVKECGWLSSNPCVRVSKLREARGRDRVITPDECARLLEACQNSRSEHLYLIVLLAITTGMRQGEILSLTWKCIHFDNQLITLSDTKNGRPRTVPLVGQALQLMQERFLQRSLHSHLVFPSKTRFGKVTIRKAWEEALKRARIQGLRFHDLRHSFATYAAEAGASNIALATAMGHQTLQMLQRYTHMNANMTRSLSESVEERLLPNHSERQPELAQPGNKPAGQRHVI